LLTQTEDSDGELN